MYDENNPPPDGWNYDGEYDPENWSVDPKPSEPGEYGPVSKKRCNLCDGFPGGQCPACAVPDSPTPAKEQSVFSWDVAENHLFQVVREPRQRTKPGDPHPGFEWVCLATIARFYGAAAPVLLDRCVQALRSEGWAWVKPFGGAA